MYEILEQKLEESNAIPNINHGGCAANALAICLYIKTNLPEILNPSVIYICSNAEHNKEYIEAGNYLDLSCHHAMVMCIINDKIVFIDSTGTHSKPIHKGTIKKEFTELSDSFCSESVYKDPHWCKSFDRNYIEKIEEIFGVKTNFEALGMSA